MAQRWQIWLARTLGQRLAARRLAVGPTHISNVGPTYCNGYFHNILPTFSQRSTSMQIMYTAQQLVGKHWHNVGLMYTANSLDALRWPNVYLMYSWFFYVGQTLAQCKIPNTTFCQQLPTVANVGPTLCQQCVLSGVPTI